MFLKPTVLLLSFAALAVVRPVHGHPVSGSAIELDVQSASGPGHVTMPRVVTCTLDTSLTPTMNRVTALILFASRPYGQPDEFDPLVTVDQWWTSGPRLLNGLDASDVNVDGTIGSGSTTKSHLIFSWKSPRNSESRQYRCVAKGLDNSGREVTISITSDAASGSSSDASSDGDALLLLKTVIDGVANVTMGLEGSVHTAVNDVGVLKRTVDSLEELVKTQNSTIANLQERVASFTDMYKFSYLMSNFDVSEDFKGKRYCVSKAVGPFNIQAADSMCALLGGYLAEIDDDDEFNFVLKFLNFVGKAQSDLFFTGGNDLNEEGSFRFWHSKKSIEFFKWRHPSEPNNSNNDEHCIEITLSQSGYNDRPCNTRAKFICEIQA